jgi:deoxyxylulose-5-phosphate synthase
LNEHGFTGKVIQLGIPDEFVDHGNRQTLLDNLNLTPTRIAEKIRQILLEQTVLANKNP